MKTQQVKTSGKFRVVRKNGKGNFVKKILTVASISLIGLYLLKAMCSAFVVQAVGGGSYWDRVKDEFIDPDGMNLLHHAALSQNEKSVRLYLSLGWNPNAKDAYGRTPLLLVASHGAMNHTSPEQIEISELLISKGARIDEQTAKGKTALMEAAFSARLQLSEFLIRKGASLNILDAELHTALDYARSIAGRPITEDLRKLGAEFGAEVKIENSKFRVYPKGSDIELIEVPAHYPVRELKASWDGQYQGYSIDFLIDMNQTCKQPANCNQTALAYLQKLKASGAIIKRKGSKPLKRLPKSPITQKQYDEAYYWGFNDCKIPLYSDISNAPDDLKVRIFIFEKPFAC